MKKNKKNIVRRRNITIKRVCLGFEEEEYPQKNQRLPSAHNPSPNNIKAVLRGAASYYDNITLSLAKNTKNLGFNNKVEEVSTLDKFKSSVSLQGADLRK